MRPSAIPMLSLLWVLVTAAACTTAGSSDDTSTDTDTDPDTEPTPPLSVLFVGNSFTYWNGGVDSHVEALRVEAGGITFQTTEMTLGGASLEVMWEDTDVVTRIAQGGFDVVVLQEDIPETTVASFHEYARRFDREIRDSGATPVLFMAWDYERLNWISMPEISAAHWTIADELSIPVAPVGLAWKRSAEQRPTLNMYDNDDEHPSIEGTYLAATTIYSVLFDENPAGLTYRPNGVSQDEAAFIQGIAWTEIQAN